MQFAPLSSSANGSAKRRVVTFGARGFDVGDFRSSATAVSTGSAIGSAGCCGVGSHTAMTCTAGSADLGLIFGMSRSGGGGADFARNPSGQVSARTCHGAGRGRCSAGFVLSRRTWTTSTTLLWLPPKPPFRGALSMWRVSLDVGCGPCPLWRGKTRSASDMNFHLIPARAGSDSHVIWCDAKGADSVVA